MPLTDEQFQIFCLEKAVANAQGNLDHVAKELRTIRETLMAEQSLDLLRREHSESTETAQ